MTFKQRRDPWIPVSFQEFNIELQTVLDGATLIPHTQEKNNIFHETAKRRSRWKDGRLVDSAAFRLRFKRPCLPTETHPSPYETIFLTIERPPQVAHLAKIDEPELDVQLTAHTPVEPESPLTVQEVDMSYSLPEPPFAGYGGHNPLLVRWQLDLIGKNPQQPFYALKAEWKPFAGSFLTLKLQKELGSRIYTTLNPIFISPHKSEQSNIIHVDND